MCRTRGAQPEPLRHGQPLAEDGELTVGGRVVRARRRRRSGSTRRRPRCPRRPGPSRPPRTAPATRPAVAPPRDSPVSILRWTRAGRPARPGGRRRSRPAGRATAAERSTSAATPSCSGSPGASSQARTGAVMPCRRSSSASPRVQTPSQVAPPASAARADGTRPWPYPSPFTTAMTSADVPWRRRAMLLRIASRSTRTSACHMPQPNRPVDHRRAVRSHVPEAVDPVSRTRPLPAQPSRRRTGRSAAATSGAVTGAAAAAGRRRPGQPVHERGRHRRPVRRQPGRQQRDRAGRPARRRCRPWPAPGVPVGLTQAVPSGVATIVRSPLSSTTTPSRAASCRAASTRSGPTCSPASRVNSRSCGVTTVGASRRRSQPASVPSPSRVRASASITAGTERAEHRPQLVLGALVGAEPAAAQPGLHPAGLGHPAAPATTDGCWPGPRRRRPPRRSGPCRPARPAHRRPTAARRPGTAVEPVARPTTPRVYLSDAASAPGPPAGDVGRVRHPARPAARPATAGRCRPRRPGRRAGRPGPPPAPASGSRTSPSRRPGPPCPSTAPVSTSTPLGTSTLTTSGGRRRAAAAR